MAIKRAVRIQHAKVAFVLAICAPLVAIGLARSCHADGPTSLQLQTLLAAGNAGSSPVADTVARQIATAAGNLALTAVQSSGGDATNTVTTAVGTTTARSQGARAADTVNVRDYGAKGDLVIIRENVYTSAGSTTVVLSNGGMTSSMVGKTVIIANAGPAGTGSHLVSPIVTVSDATHVVLQNPALATGTFTGQVMVGYHAISSTFSFTSGSAVIIASSAVFTPHMVGSIAIFPGAAVAPLVAKIISVPSQSSLILDSPASTTDTNDGQNIPIGTDDSAAFASAVAAAEARSTPAIWVPDGLYMMLSSLNLTGWSNGRVSGTGTLYGAATDQPVVDLLSARFTRWEGVSIMGDSATLPMSGMSVGRISANSADNHRFSDFNISGSFGVAALLDIGAETTPFAFVHFSNALGPFAVVLDGIHHFAETSSYVTQIQPFDIPNSYNEASFLSCIFSTTSVTGAPLWISNTAKMRLDESSYLSSASTQAIIVYGTSGATVALPVVDVHMEPTTLLYNFVFDGTAASQVTNLEWRDHNIQASIASFHIDPDAGFTSVTLNDVNMILGLNSLVSPTLVDIPQDWIISGEIHAPTKLFNLISSNWSGCYSDIYDATICAYSLRQLNRPVQQETITRQLSSSDCGTLIRDTGTTSHDFIVPTGLGISCRIDIVQVGIGGIINIRAGTGMTAETVAGTITLSHQNPGMVALGYIQTDSMSSFIFSAATN